MTLPARLPPSLRTPALPLELGACVAVCVALALPLTAAAADAACRAESGSTVAPVVELYTSEGCNSCPPADRWLSGLRADTGIVALAFHVDYWDRLGWKDRFGSPAYTQRQALQRQSNGARFSYTPQVVVDGRDRPDWRGRPAPSSTRERAGANVAIALQRDGTRITATVQPQPGAPARLAAFWAVTEHGHDTAVKAGENEGVTLRHDHVVREYRQVTAWPADPSRAATIEFQIGSAPEPGHARDVNFVVLDADTGRPVQALKLGC